MVLLWPILLATAGCDHVLGLDAYGPAPIAPPSKGDHCSTTSVPEPTLFVSGRAASGTAISLDACQATLAADGALVVAFDSDGACLGAATMLGAGLSNMPPALYAGTADEQSASYLAVPFSGDVTIACAHAQQQLSAGAGTQPSLLARVQLTQDGLCPTWAAVLRGAAVSAFDLVGDHQGVTVTGAVHVEDLRLESAQGSEGPASFENGAFVARYNAAGKAEELTVLGGDSAAGRALAALESSVLLTGNTPSSVVAPCKLSTTEKGFAQRALLWRGEEALACDSVETLGAAGNSQLGYGIALQAAPGGGEMLLAGLAGRAAWTVGGGPLPDPGSAQDGFVAKLRSAASCDTPSTQVWAARLVPSQGSVFASRVALAGSLAFATGYFIDAGTAPVVTTSCANGASCSVAELLPQSEADTFVAGFSATGEMLWNLTVAGIGALPDPFSTRPAGVSNLVASGTTVYVLIEVGSMNGVASIANLITDSADCASLTNSVAAPGLHLIALSAVGKAGQAECLWSRHLPL